MEKAISYSNRNFTLYIFFRLSVVASCHMDLHMYPADKQTCYLNIHSCKFNIF